MAEEQESQKAGIDPSKATPTPASHGDILKRLSASPPPSEAKRLPAGWAKSSAPKVSSPSKEATSLNGYTPPRLSIRFVLNEMREDPDDRIFDTPAALNEVPAPPVR